MHLSHRFTSASKCAAYKSFHCCLTHFHTSVSTFSSSAKHLSPSCELPFTTNTSHHKEETFVYEMSFALSELFCPQKMHSRTLLFGSTLLKHGCHFYYWNQPLNMRMRICYLDCHEAGLYCYLVIHIENLLCPLQLFYLHLWPIYWLSLIHNTVK
jgi:hypothetical protein